MANITEEPIEMETMAGIHGCAAEGLELLGIVAKAGDPKAVVAAIDAFVYAWQKGQRPPAEKLDPDAAPLILGSLWGEQLVRRFGWEWAMITFHDHEDAKTPGVLSPDRSLAVYPIHFLTGCFEDPQVDATIALAYNMLDAGATDGLEPGEYFNLMDGVQRIVPRD